MTLRKQLEQHVRDSTRLLMERTLAHTPVSPDALTLAGALLTVGAVVFIAQGAFAWAGVAVFIASAFDMLDGALARAKNQTSIFGAFFDSTLDRYSDALLMLGFLIFFQHASSQSPEIVLTFVAAAGSLLTSYTRARAEALGFSCNVGLVERPERIMLIVLGLLSSLITPMLWTLAILANVTALQRIIHVWHVARASQPQSVALPGE